MYLSQEKAFLNWSSGKDSAFVLYVIQKQSKYNIIKLFTTLNTQTQRVSMHGLSLEVLQRQVLATGLELDIMYYDSSISMDSYQHKMHQKMLDFKREGVFYSLYGDILLEDLRDYRENQLAKVGITGIFPLWKRNSKELLLEMIDAGLKTIIICVNQAYLDKSFLGRVIDRQFLDDLPNHVDPCGENGEYHSFAFDGPMFKYPVKFSIGKTVFKSYDNPQNDKDLQNYGFWFLEIL